MGMKMDNRKSFKFTVPGPPQGKGRPRFVRATGRTYTPQETANYENLIKVCAMEALNVLDEEWLLSGQYHLVLNVFFPLPKSRPQVWKSLAKSNDICPITKPDIDNIIKAFGDALNGIAWKDDSMVTSIIACKCYAEIPRCEVRVFDITSPHDRWTRKK